MTSQRRSPEADHERGVVAPLYGSCSFSVFATSARVHPVGVTPGIADLIIFSGLLGITFFHETKVGTERQSAEQYGFMADALASGSCYVLGDVASANQFLCWLGLAVPLNETIRFHSRSQWRGRLQMMQDSDKIPLTAKWQSSDEFHEQQDRWGYRASTRPLARLPRRGTP